MHFHESYIIHRYHFHFYSVNYMSVSYGSHFYHQQDPNCYVQQRAGVPIRSEIECLIMCSSNPYCMSSMISHKVITEDKRKVCQLLYSNSCTSCQYIQSLITVIHFIRPNICVLVRTYFYLQQVYIYKQKRYSKCDLFKCLGKDIY